MCGATASVWSYTAFARLRAISSRARLCCRQSSTRWPAASLMATCAALRASFCVCSLSDASLCRSTQVGFCSFVGSFRKRSRLFVLHYKLVFLPLMPIANAGAVFVNLGSTIRPSRPKMPIVTHIQFFFQPGAKVNTYCLPNLDSHWMLRHAPLRPIRF